MTADTDPRLAAVADVLRDNFEGLSTSLARDIAKVSLESADRAAWRPIDDRARDGSDVLVRGSGTFHGVPFMARWVPSEYHPDSPWMQTVSGQRLMDRVDKYRIDVAAIPPQEDSKV